MCSHELFCEGEGGEGGEDGERAGSAGERGKREGKGRGGRETESETEHAHSLVPLTNPVGSEPHPYNFIQP